MRFESWKEEYSDAVDNWFSDLAEEPGDYREFADAMQEAIDDFREKYDLPDMRCIIAFYDIEEFNSRYDSDYPSKFAYRNAFSMTTELSDLDRNTVFMAVHPEFPERVGNWKGIVKYDTIHELAHQVYFDRTDMGLRVPAWKKMVFEGHAMYLAEEIGTEKGYGVDYPFLEMPDVDIEKVRKELDRNIGGRDDTSEELSQLFSYGGGRFTEAEGYPLAFNVMKELVESGHEIEEIMDLEDDEMRGKVVEVLEDLI